MITAIKSRAKAHEKFQDFRVLGFWVRGVVEPPTPSHHGSGCFAEVMVKLLVGCRVAGRPNFFPVSTGACSFSHAVHCACS